MAQIQPRIDRLARGVLHLLLWATLPLLMVGASAAPTRQTADLPRHYLPMVKVGDYRIAFVSLGDENNQLAPSGAPPLYTVNLYVMNADGSGRTRLTNGTNGAMVQLMAWSPDGRQIAFYSSGLQGGLSVVNTDGSGLTNLIQTWVGSLAWSPGGHRIAFSGCRNLNSLDCGGGEIYVINADGSGLTNLTNNQSSEDMVAWSPDGHQIAYQFSDGEHSEIYVMNADGSGQTNLTNDQGLNVYPAWLPDGRQIAFVSDRNGNSEIYVMNADGSGQTNLTNSQSYEEWPAWSPDGRRIAYGDGQEIYLVNADGSGQINLTNNGVTDSGPLAWSPTIQGSSTPAAPMP